MEENNRSESQITNPANTNVQIVSVQGNPGEGFGIASLITALLGLSIIPVILGFIGLSKSKKISQKNGPALAGVIIGFISFFIKIVIILVIIAISYSSYELMKKDVFISRPDIELPTVRQEKDQLICDETNYPKIKPLARDNRYKLYINGDVEGEGSFAYATYGSEILICSYNNNQLFKAIEIPQDININPSSIDISNLDYVLLDSGTDLPRSKTLIKLESGDIKIFYAYGIPKEWNDYLIYRASDGDQGWRRYGGGYAIAIWALELESGESKPIIRASVDYDYNLGDFSEDSFTYVGEYYSHETMLEGVPEKNINSTYYLNDLINEFKK